MTIADILRTDDRFSRFRALAERTDTTIAPSWLDVWDWDPQRLGGDREGVTVFVPTDAAFELVDPAILAILDDPAVDQPLLYDLLGHHFVHRLYPSSRFQPGPQHTWRRSRDPVELTVDPPTWGGHLIVETDVLASNGYVHVIGGVVIPDSLATRAASRE